MTRSTEGCKPIVISNNCMLADRCVVLPGTIMERGSVIGSGGLTKEDFTYPQGSVYVGSRAGNGVCIVSEDILRKSSRYDRSPFGLAFYDRTAPFFVLPLPLIIIYNTIIQVFCSVYHHVGPIISIYITVATTGNIYETTAGLNGVCPFSNALWRSDLSRLIILCIPIYFVLNVYALFIDISAKWLIIGQRKQGSYPWNVSDYCQVIL